MWLIKQKAAEDSGPLPYSPGIFCGVFFACLLKICRYCRIHQNLQDTQVLQQDLESQEDQDHSSGQFGFCFIFCPENVADLYTGRQRMINVVAPIKDTAATILTFRNAKVIPTARASILVATARRKHGFYIQRVISFFAFA